MYTITNYIIGYFVPSNRIKNPVITEKTPITEQPLHLWLHHPCLQGKLV